MILPIAAAVAFYQLAKSRGLIAWPWSIFALLGYFGAPFMAGIIIALVIPEMLYQDDLELTVISMVSSVVGLVLVWIILEQVARKKKKKVKVKERDSNILDDDQYLERL